VLQIGDFHHNNRKTFSSNSYFKGSSSNNININRLINTNINLKISIKIMIITIIMINLKDVILNIKTHKIEEEETFQLKAI
jgi:hypothetical protein